MFSYVRAHAALALAYIVLSVGSTLVSLVFARLIDASIGSAVNGNRNGLVESVIEAAIAAAAGIVLAVLSTRCYGVFKARIMRDIRTGAVRRLLQLRLSFIEGSHTGDLVSRYTHDLSTVQTFIGQDLFRLAVTLISVSISSAYLMTVNWKLFLFSMSLMPPALYLSTLISKPMGGFFQEASKHFGAADSLAQDAYGGITIIKAFNLENHFHEKFRTLMGVSTRSLVNAARLLRWMPIFNIINWSSPWVICMIYGAWLSIRGEISPGQLPAFMYLLGNIVWPVSSIPHIVSNFRRSLGTAQRFFEVTDAPAERVDGDVPGERDPGVCIAFRDVTFAYDGTADTGKAHTDGSDEPGGGNGVPDSDEPAGTDRERPAERPRSSDRTAPEVLRSFSLELETGKRLALVGSSGCGKSTVLKLLCAFYDCREGRIELFGRDLRDWSIEGLRRTVSLVSQDAFLFPTDMYENIACGKAGATTEEVVEAAKAAHAHEFIMELPEGYRTTVGERGVKLSGGQRQRVAVARAFLKNAPILLLDEATSSLDSKSERQVQDAISTLMKGKSTLVIAHRLSTVEHADVIYLVDGGRVTERGTHEELLAEGGMYRTLYERQFT